MCSHMRSTVLSLPSGSKYPIQLPNRAAPSNPNQPGSLPNSTERPKSPIKPEMSRLITSGRVSLPIQLTPHPNCAASQITSFAPLTARLGNCAPFLCYFSAGRTGNVIAPTGFPDTSDCAGPENPAGSMKDGSGPDGAPNNNAKKAHFRQLWHQFGAFWCVFVLFFGGRTG